MSADNWAVCPRCWDKAQEEHLEAVANVMALYGEVPIEEFDAKRDALQAPSQDDFQTFREDYEFYGVEGGEITASYTGGCSKCGLSCQFSTSKKFYTRATLKDEVTGV